MMRDPRQLDPNAGLPWYWRPIRFIGGFLAIPLGLLILAVMALVWWLL